MSKIYNILKTCHSTLKFNATAQEETRMKSELALIASYFVFRFYVGSIPAIKILFKLQWIQFKLWSIYVVVVYNIVASGNG